MTAMEIGSLPKIRGGGRKSNGLWPGHAEEAAVLRELARVHPEEWGLVAKDVPSYTASRIANLINNGRAADFPRDDDGHYEAKTRRGDSMDKSNVHARFVPRS